MKLQTAAILLGAGGSSMHRLRARLVSVRESRPWKPTPEGQGNLSQVTGKWTREQFPYCVGKKAVLESGKLLKFSPLFLHGFTEASDCPEGVDVCGQL